MNSSVQLGTTDVTQENGAILTLASIVIFLQIFIVANK